MGQTAFLRLAGDSLRNSRKSSRQFEAGYPAGEAAMIGAGPLTHSTEIHRWTRHRVPYDRSAGEDAVCNTRLCLPPAIYNGFQIQYTRSAQQLLLHKVKDERRRRRIEEHRRLWWDIVPSSLVCWTAMALRARGHHKKKGNGAFRLDTERGGRVVAPMSPPETMCSVYPAAPSRDAA